MNKQTIKLSELTANDKVVLKKTAKRAVEKRKGYFNPTMSKFLGHSVNIREVINHHYETSIDSSKYDFNINEGFHWPFEAIKLTAGVIRDGKKYKLTK